MPQPHPFALLIARLRAGMRTPPANDDGDLGTAFGMEMRLRETEQANAAAPPAPPAGDGWFRRRGQGAARPGRG